MNAINWNYREQQETKIKAEQAERSRRYKMFLAEHDLYQQTGYETLKTQIYFSFMQDAEPEIISYFFDEENLMSSIDIDCFRLLSVLYSLDAVKSLIAQSGMLSMDDIHEFIFIQERNRHPESQETEETTSKPLAEEQTRILNELLDILRQRTEASNRYEMNVSDLSSRMDAIKEAYHQKEIEQADMIASLREQLAELKTVSGNTEEMLLMKIENEKIKAAKEKAEEIHKLQMDIAQREKEVEIMNNRISELQHEAVMKKLIAGNLDPGSTTRKKRFWLFRRKRKACDPKLELMKNVLSNAEYPFYQIAFIGQCYLENMSEEELMCFEKPGIPLDNMMLMKSILLAERSKDCDT